MTAGLLLAVAVGVTGSPLTTPSHTPVPVDASTTQIFGLRWRLPVVRTGFGRKIVASFGQPGFVPGSDLVVVGTGEGEVLCLSTNDGHTVWRYHYGVGFETPVTMLPASGTSVTGPRALLSSLDGKLLAFDALTGKLAWKADLGAASRAPATVAGQLVLVTTEANKLFALNRQTGAVVWTGGRPPPTGLTIEGHSAPTVHGGRVFATFSDGYAEAYNLADGSRLWSRPLSFKAKEFSDADADPFVADGRLFVASYSDGIYALDPKDGSTLWSQPAAAVTSLAALPGAVLAASANGWLWALGAKHGQLRYRTRVPRGPMSRLLVRRGLVLLTNGPVGLLVLDAHTGKPLQDTAVGERFASDPAWAEGDARVAVLSTAGYLYMLRAGTLGNVVLTP